METENLRVKRKKREKSVQVPPSEHFSIYFRKLEINQTKKIFFALFHFFIHKCSMQCYRKESNKTQIY